VAMRYCNGINYNGCSVIVTEGTDNWKLESIGDP